MMATPPIPQKKAPKIRKQPGESVRVSPAGEDKDFRVSYWITDCRSECRNIPTGQLNSRFDQRGNRPPSPPSILFQASRRNRTSSKWRSYGCDALLGFGLDYIEKTTLY
jgi:hypothetical protein